MMKTLQTVLDVGIVASDKPAPAERPSEYRFPATQGFQCHDFYWLLALPFTEARQLFDSFLSRKKPDKNQPLSLAQRTLNTARARKILRYIVRGLAEPQGFYVLPPITVTFDIPSGDGFEFLGVDLEEEGEETNLLLSLQSSVVQSGELLLPPDTTFWISDGQHRALGAALAAAEAPALVQNETIPVMLIPDSMGGKKRRQIFLDINQHAVKPSKSIVSLFDGRDESSEIARAVLLNVPIFEGRTNLEATNVPKGSDDLFTMNSLRESCKVLLTGLEGDMKQETAITFWKEVSRHHPDWKAAMTCDSLQVLRAESLGFNALTLSALAMVGNLRLQQGEGMKWVKRLDKVQWNVSNPDWTGVCRFNGRIVKNSATIKSLASYMAEKTK